MKDKEVIVDASVTVKMYSLEEGSDGASDLFESSARGSVMLYAPELVVYETMNALRYSKMKEADAKDCMKDLFTSGLTLIGANTELTDKTVEHARRYDITCYDAAYTALAEILDARLVTADDKLLRKIKNEKIAIALRDVGEYQ